MTLEATSPPPSAAFSRKNFCSHIGSMALRILLLSTFLCIAASQTIVKTPPGYSGELPFTLETGLVSFTMHYTVSVSFPRKYTMANFFGICRYIGVDDSEDVQMFYYFVESQRTPLEYPLMLWLTGGPGCSTLLAFFYESGKLLTTYCIFCCKTTLHYSHSFFVQ